MRFVDKIKKLRHDIWLGFWRKTPIQKNKVLLWSDNFKTFGCSPKYIALELIRRGGWDVVWVLERGKETPQVQGMRIVRYFSMEYLKEITTAKFIICNHRTNEYHYFRKRKGQIYIQTWHSSLRLKMIEKDAIQFLPEHEMSAKEDSKKIDLLLSGCSFSTQIFRRAFWYDGEILEKGTPRCDAFFQDNTDIKNKVYNFYDISKEKKLLLYAPTFRSEKNYDYALDFETLGKVLGEDWALGCRLHPNLNACFRGGAVDMCRYPDMQELLQSCDLLITDYSSSMFDMVVARKPCVLYVPDLAQYQKNERGLYFNIDDLPFPKAQDMQDLCNCVTNLDCYQEKYVSFLEEIGSFETGNAAKSVVEYIEKITQRR